MGLAGASIASAQSGLPVTGSAAVDATSADAKVAVEWLVDHGLQRLPRSFDGDKDWGDTKKVWSGVKMRMDGLELKTHRRFRDVEHGRWIKYQVNLPGDHMARPVEVRIHQVVPIVELSTAQQRWRIDSSVLVPMTFTAQIQRWSLGVKLFSVTVSGEMKVRMDSSATIGIYADYAKIPPDLIIDPHVERATLRLERFEVERVSHIGGDAAEAWGEIMQEVLVERFVKAQDDRLAQKLNKSIDKERDNLKISMSSWLMKLTPNK